MNKKNLLLLILVVVFLLTGCSVRSEVVVDYNGKVTEKVTVLTNSAAFENDNYSKEQMIENVISNYSAALNYRGYQNDIVVGEKESGATFTHDYDNICSYFQDTGFNQYVYPHVSCSEDDYYITIQNDTEYIPYCSDCSDWPSLNNVELRLTLPVKAEEHNADEVDGNTYVWKYDENTTDKDIYIKINKTALEENKKDVERQNEEKERQKVIITVSIVVGVIVVLALISLMLYKKYKSNKLEY